MSSSCWIALLAREPEGVAPAMVGVGMPAWVALQFTPHVAAQKDTLLLEMSGSLQLWGSVHRVLQELRFRLESVGICVAAMVQGATAGQALAVLQLARAGTPVPAKVPEELPLCALDIPAPRALALAHLGCHTWGDLRALPRAGVARRFGAQTLYALDQAMGLEPHGLRWLVIPETFDLSAELSAPAESAPALLYAASRLLQALQAWLQMRLQGALAVELSWKHELRRYAGVDLPPGQKILVRTAQPTQDMGHLRRLLAEHLARIALAAPASQIRLRLRQSAPWSRPTESLLDAAAPKKTAIAWHELIERLGARLGAEQVQVPEEVADHRPEAMQRWRPAAQLPAPRPADLADKAADHLPDARLLPTWLLRPARPLAVRGQQPCYLGRLRLLAGPQRLETGWWNEPGGEGADTALAVRDYFVAHNAAAGWVWIYRERPPSHCAAARPCRWFLQGIYA